MMKSNQDPLLNEEKLLYLLQVEEYDETTHPSSTHAKLSWMEGHLQALELAAELLRRAVDEQRANTFQADEARIQAAREALEDS